MLSGAHSDDVYTVAVSRLCLLHSLNGKKTAVKERMPGSGVGVSSQQPCLVASDLNPVALSGGLAGILDSLPGKFLGGVSC